MGSGTVEASVIVPFEILYFDVTRFAHFRLERPFNIAVVVLLPRDAWVPSALGAPFLQCPFALRAMWCITFSCTHIICYVDFVSTVQVKQSVNYKLQIIMSNVDLYVGTIQYKQSINCTFYTKSFFNPFPRYTTYIVSTKVVLVWFFVLSIILPNAVYLI